MMTTLGCASMLALTLHVGAPPAAPAPTATQKVSAAKKATGAKKATAKKATGAQKADKPLTKTVAKKVPDAKTLLDKVQSYYANIEDWRADFIQRHTKVALSRTTESRGVLMLKKPSFMRWAYNAPAEKLWVVDGDTLWVVDPEFEQYYTRKNFKTEELQSSISFLWGKGRLDKSFHVKVGDNEKYEAGEDQAVLELTPKSGATYTKLVLILDAASGAVAESIIYETAGNTNHFKFRNPKKNTKLKRDLFRYTPPDHFEDITPPGS